MQIIFKFHRVELPRVPRMPDEESAEEDDEETQLRASLCPEGQSSSVSVIFTRHLSQRVK